MGNNHLTYFKIENFKKFDSLEVNDIGQFNLIVGDNNVGKTCFLEALLFDEDGQQLLNNFYLALTKRGLKFQIEEVTRKVNDISTTETISPKGNYFKEYIFGKKEELEIYYKIKDEPSSIIIAAPQSNIIIKYNNAENTRGGNIYGYDLNILNFPLISFNDTPLEEETIKIYETLKTKREKEILLNALKVVNNKIAGIDFRGNFNDLKSVFLISYDDKDEYFPLNTLGDGFKRIFYIVLKAISLKGKRILIDEIEIGIHYSKMKDFWINIMKVCKELDVQLFATTHSSECIESYVNAAKELNEHNIRLIKLKENKDKSIKAICYKEEYIEYMVESSTEER